MKKIAFLIFVVCASATGAGWWTASNNAVLTSQQPVIVAKAMETKVAGAMDITSLSEEDTEASAAADQENADAAAQTPVVTSSGAIVANLGGSKVVFDSTSGTFTCSTNTSCNYAAVDKTHPLPSSYIPNVVSANVQGGAYLTPDAAYALEKLFSEAKARGINVTVTSSYRSYATQETTFNNWVNIIKANNPSYTNEQARAEANTFSALPGYSEHQLGTTADLNTVGATPFENQGNEALYTFIENNAHRFGFVITYPKNQQAVTGYVHEPWHIRFVGTQVAGQLYATGYVNGNGNYSAKFLRDNNFSD